MKRINHDRCPYQVSSNPGRRLRPGSMRAALLTAPVHFSMATEVLREGLEETRAELTMIRAGGSTVAFLTAQKDPRWIISACIAGREFFGVTRG